MDFKLNIGTLNSAIKEYENLINKVSEEKAKVNRTLMELKDKGWSGQASDKFMEVHEINNAKFATLENELNKTKNILENEVKKQAKDLKSFCNNFASYAANGDGISSSAMEDSGVVSISYSNIRDMQNIIDSAIDTYYSKIKFTNNGINNNSNFKYKKFSFDDEVGSYNYEIFMQTEKLQRLKSALVKYQTDVDKFDNDMSSKLKVLVDSDNAMFKQKLINIGVMNALKAGNCTVQQLCYNSINNSSSDEVQGSLLNIQLGMFFNSLMPGNFTLGLLGYNNYSSNLLKEIDAYLDRNSITDIGMMYGLSGVDFIQENVAGLLNFSTYFAEGLSITGDAIHSISPFYKGRSLEEIHSSYNGIRSAIDDTSQDISNFLVSKSPNASDHMLIKTELNLVSLLFGAPAAVNKISKLPSAIQGLKSVQIIDNMGIVWNNMVKGEAAIAAVGEAIKGATIAGGITYSNLINFAKADGSESSSVDDVGSGGSEGVSNPNKYSLSGEEHYESLKDLFGADNVKWETKGKKYDNAIFANDEKLVSHYWKHGKEFEAYSLDDYLNQAREVMNNGYEVNYPYKGEIRTGFLQYYGTSKKNGAKFAFVGTNNEGFITTFHTESGKTFWKMLNGQNIKIINPN